MDGSRRSELLRQMRSLAADVFADASSSEPFRIQTRIHIAYAEGFENHMALTQNISTLQIQLSLTQYWVRPDARALGKKLPQFFVEWERRMEQLIQDAKTVGVPWLHAECAPDSPFDTNCPSKLQKIPIPISGSGRTNLIVRKSTASCRRPKRSQRFSPPQAILKGK